MKVAIDCRMVLSHPTGIGRVVENVVRCLAENPDGDEFTAFCRPGVMTDLPPSIRRVETDVPQFSLEVFTELPRIINREKPDLIHFPYLFHPSLFLSAPYVVTIHDTVYSYFPGRLSRREHLVYRIMMRRSIKKASLVLTGSQSAKQGIMRFFKGDEARTRVIPMGVEERFHPIEDGEAFRARYQLPERYILYVGNHRPHKNVPALVDAFARISKDIPHYLVLPWYPDFDCERTEEAVAKAGISDRVVFLRDFSDEALPNLYSAADVFAFPSMHEGFGLPPLEAMACGTPVVTSNASSIPEVVGDAGIMIDPRDTDGLADALLRILSDEDLSRDLSRRGIERAKQFSWAQTARLVRQAYHEALQR